jgi:hypothetical protein
MSQLRRKNPISGLIDDAKDAILSPVIGLEPKKTAKYQKFAESVMRTILTGYESNRSYDDPKQAEIIKKWRARLESSDFLDEVMCNEMIADLSKFIDDKDAAKKYQDAAKTSVDAVFKGIKENSLKEDEKWKQQLFQLFAIMTPLGAFSIAGNVFNYLGPIMDLFGPVLGKAGVAEGISKVATSKQLGPFGKLAEIMRVDDVIKTVLTKTPILSEVIEIADILTTNKNVQLMGAEIAPLATASELPLLLIAGLISTRNVVNHSEQSKNSKIIEERSNATLNKLRDTMPKPKVSAPKKDEKDKIELKTKEKNQNEKDLKENSKEKKEDKNNEKIDAKNSTNENNQKFSTNNSEIPNPSPSPTSRNSNKNQGIDYKKLVSEPEKINVENSSNISQVR